jgi:similar to stage IV sporulation protein
MSRGSDMPGRGENEAVAADMFPKFIRGKVDIICRGPDLPVLINRAVNEQIAVEHAFWVDEHRIQVTIPLPDFFRFIRLAREQGVRIRVAGKQGWPFLLGRIKQRKGFVIGIFAFVFLIFLLSSFVWSVHIEGTERIPAKHVRALLRQEGVYEGQWKNRIPDPEQIKHRLLMRMPQASWVGIRVEGTRVVVTVVEKDQPEPPQSEFENKGPVHLVAKRDALIRDLLVERGHPLTEVGDMVRRGQVLVSGIYGDPAKPEANRIAGAQGKVLGEVWYVSDVVAPLDQKRKVFTGNRWKQELPMLLGTVIQNPLADPPPFRQFEIIRRARYYGLGGWRLPVVWVK